LFCFSFKTAAIRLIPSQQQTPNAELNIVQHTVGQLPTVLYISRYKMPLPLLSSRDQKKQLC